MMYCRGVVNARIIFFKPISSFEDVLLKCYLFVREFCCRWCDILSLPDGRLPWLIADNMGEDCPVFDNLFEFCQIYAGGTIGES